MSTSVSTRPLVMDYMKKEGIFDSEGFIQNESTIKPTKMFKQFAKYYDLTFQEANRITVSDIGKQHLQDETEYTGWLRDVVDEVGLEYENHWDIMEPIMKYIYKWSGVVNSYSVHASGTIMVNYIPDLPMRDGVFAYNGHDFEDNGYIKYDLLSIDTLNYIQPFTGLDVNWKDTSDPKVWSEFQKGDTDFAFQFGSNQMKKLLIDNHTGNIDALAEINALNRPGPIKLGLLETYTNNTNGKKDFNPENAVLYLLLKREFGNNHAGLAIFQEDIMKIVSAGADFNLVESDDIRRAMGKKDKDLLESYSGQFKDNWKYNEYYDFGPEIGKYLKDDTMKLTNGKEYTAEEVYKMVQDGKDIDIDTNDIEPRHIW